MLQRRILRGFTPCSDAVLRFLTRPVVIELGMLVKTGLPPEAHKTCLSLY